MKPAGKPSLPHSATPTPRIIEVAAGLIFRDGRVLITQRHAEAHQGGLWEFPGGKREPGETFAECLARELREELGVDVSVGGLFQSVTHTYPEKTVCLKFFRCRLTTGEPRTIGCASLAWVEGGELHQYAFPAADQRLLERLVAARELWQA